MSNSILDRLSSTNEIRKELIYGKGYRKIAQKQTPLHPVTSSMNTSFFLQQKRMVRTVEESVSTPKSSNRIKQNGRNSKSVPIIKNSFWERAKLTHKQYTDILSTPHLHPSPETDKNIKKFRAKTLPNICSPRLIKMSHPNKRRILGVWQEFGDHLSLGAVHRIKDLLQATDDVDMQAVHEYFKSRDRKKKRIKRKRRTQKRKKKGELERLWLKYQVEDTSKKILRYLSDVPNIELNFKQLLVSDVLLNVLAKTIKRTKPFLRHSGNRFSRELVKMTDKMAIWIDSVSRIVDIQDLEYIEQQEIEAEDGEPSAEPVSDISNVSFDINNLEETEENTQVARDGNLDKPDKSLQNLIHLLAQSSNEYLSGTVNEMEDLTRNELLNKLKILNKGHTSFGDPVEILKKILFDWAVHNDPTKVDDNLIGEIEKVAANLSAMLTAEDIYAMSLKGDNEKDGFETEDFDEDEAEKQEAQGEEFAPGGKIAQESPLQTTSSGNVLPTVYDINGKPVEDPEEEKTTFDTAIEDSLAPEMADEE